MVFLGIWSGAWNGAKKGLFVPFQGLLKPLCKTSEQDQTLGESVKGFAQRFLANGWGRVWNGTVTPSLVINE
jgi:hypothetical protein